MKKMDELMTTLQLDELLHKREHDKKKNTLLWVLAGACALALLRARPSWRMAAAGVLAALCLVSWAA